MLKYSKDIYYIIEDKNTARISIMLMRIKIQQDIYYIIEDKNTARISNILLRIKIQQGYLLYY